MKKKNLLQKLNTNLLKNIIFVWWHKIKYSQVMCKSEPLACPGQQKMYCLSL